MVDLGLGDRGRYARMNDLFCWQRLEWGDAICYGMASVLGNLGVNTNASYVETGIHSIETKSDNSAESRQANVLVLVISMLQHPSHVNYSSNVF